jgi:hypothetical protein
VGLEKRTFGHGARESGDSGEEDNLSVSGEENGVSSGAVARYLGVTTSAVNRLAASEETRELLKRIGGRP